MPSLFNKKVLQNRIKNYSIVRLEEKIEKIKSWQNSLSKIQGLNEKRLQSAFLSAIFEDVLKYENTPQKDEWTLDIEATTDIGAKHPDGIIGFFERKDNEEMRSHEAVIELKGPQISLDRDQKRQGTTYKSPVDQAFSYTNKLDKCKWVIVSNFMEIRLYKVGRSKEYFEVFLLDDLDNVDEFKRFHYLLNKNHLISKSGSSVTLELSEKAVKKEEDISVEFYNLYKNVRVNLFEHLKENNSAKEPELLLEKAQKFLDRIIFIGFCEDKDLLPNDLLHEAIERGNNSFNPGDTAVWNEIKAVFRSIDQGNNNHNINAYNGGLFEYDEDLDGLIITNDFFDVIYEISDYDFDSDVDVNILGHIFEQSISDIEKLKSDIKDDEFDKNESKRKKNGIYYTPQYITSYIVDNSIGSYLEDIKEELGYYDLPNIEGAGSKNWKTIYTNQHLKFYNEYEKKLKNIKVLDPACGSGAFLNQAFDYLLEEHKWLNKQRDLLKGGQSSIFALDAVQRDILKNNIFGVDLNEESVEITKLSLWLKTANKRKSLTNLDDNIKCGNSLIDDQDLVGDKAFKWEEEFKNIMTFGGFDVVVGNPPYVDNRGFNKDQLKYFSQKYKSLSTSGTKSNKTTKFNTFTLFIERLDILLKPKGIMGYIVHKNILKTTSYKGIRKFILENFIIKKIMDWGPGQFEDVVAETISIILKKGNKQDNKVKIEFYKDESQQNKNMINQSYYESSYDNIFNINLTDKDILLIKKIGKSTNKLEKFVYINNGIVTGDDSSFISDKQTDEFNKICVTGKNLNRYYLSGVKGYLNYDDQKLLRSRDKKIFEANEKLIMQMINIDLILIYDDSQLYNLGTTYAITKKSKEMGLKYILALLNSKLLNYYYKKKFTNKSFLTNAISTKNLYELPIKIPKKRIERQIIKESEKIIKAHNDKNKRVNIKFKEILNRYIGKQCFGLDSIIINSNFSNKIYSGRASKIRNYTVNINTNIVTIYLDKSSSGKYEVLKFEENNKYKRKYIKYQLENLSDNKLSKIDEKYSGNILKKTLQIEIPDYDKDHVVKKVVQEWENLQQEIKDLENEIDKIDRKIDQLVYNLYDLNAEEIQIVEKNT